MFRLMKENTPCGETETVFQTESYEHATKSRRCLRALRPWKLSACLQHGFADFYVEIPGATIDRPHFDSLDIAALEVKQAISLHSKEWRVIADHRYARIAAVHACAKVEPRVWTGGNLPGIRCSSRLAWRTVFATCDDSVTIAGITLGMIGGLK